ncbi:MAG: hypothetical protein H0V97_04730, partial [Actinobacteria bacterium]|nr:hypothetical protein [Actinomycetota bacterium]
PLPAPALTSWPRKVQFGHAARLRARLRHGAARHVLWLQRRRPGGTWHGIAHERVGRDLRARFKLEDLDRTARYRVRWHDRHSSVADKARRIRVRARVRLRVRNANVLIGRRVRMSGRVKPRVRGRTAVLHRRVDGRWQAFKRVRVGDGRFRASIRATRPGRRRVRLSFRGDRVNAPARRSRTVTVYRPELATWYGPGFYGNRTACGTILSTVTLGVAHRHLPCGSKVSFFYRGRSITVAVIDRGPYSGASWDLTSATARRIGFWGAGNVGVVR